MEVYVVIHLLLNPLYASDTVEDGVWIQAYKFMPS